MMDCLFERNLQLPRSASRYRQEAEIARMLPREGVRHKLALLMREAADWLEPETPSEPSNLPERAV